MAHLSDTPALNRGADPGGLRVGLITTPGMASALAAPEIGVQLWTLDPELCADLDGILPRVEGLGVRAFETAGLLGLTAGWFSDALVRADLTCAAWRSAQAVLDDDLAKRVEDAATLGARYLVCSSPKPQTPPPQGIDWAQSLSGAMTLSNLGRTADTLNRTGQSCASAGIRAAYHNHGLEFTQHVGRQGLDVLAQYSGRPGRLRARHRLDLRRRGRPDPDDAPSGFPPTPVAPEERSTRWAGTLAQWFCFGWRDRLARRCGHHYGARRPQGVRGAASPLDQPPLHGLRASLAYLRPLGTSASRFEEPQR